MSWKERYVKNVSGLLSGTNISDDFPFKDGRLLLIHENDSLILKYKNKPDYLYKYISFSLPQDEEKLMNLFSGKILLKQLSTFNDMEEATDGFQFIVKGADWLSDSCDVSDIIKEVFNIESKIFDHSPYHHFNQKDACDRFVQSFEYLWKNKPIQQEKERRDNLWMSMNNINKLRYFIQHYTKAFCMSETGPTEKSLMWHHYARIIMVSV